MWREEVTLSLEDKRTIGRRFSEEALAQGNLDVIDTAFARNVVIHLFNPPLHSHASLKNMLEQVHQTMSGHSVTIHDLIAEGDTVAVRHTYSATAHHSQFGKNPPTGQPVHLEATHFFHFEQGKVAEVWICSEGVVHDLSGFGE